MARRNPELDERRELIARMVKNANRKVSRLRAKGADISGSQYDVRRSADKVAKYNINQLNAYERQLTQFNSRQNSFYAGADNTVIPGKVWREYKQLEQKVNARGKRWDNAIGGVFIEQSGMTVQERRESVKASRVRAAGESTPRLFVQNKRTPGQVNGVKAVQKLIKQQKARLKADYVHQEVKKGRKAFSAMLNKMGNPELIKDLNSLTDHQFAILVKETPFADTVGLKYTSLQQMASGNTDKYLGSVVDDSSGAISDFLQSAKAYPKEKNTRSPKSRR